MKEGEAVSGSGSGGGAVVGKEAGRERQRVEKETEKERQRALKEAEKERLRQEKEAERERQRQEKEAEKERLRQEREVEKERQRQEKEAEKERQRQEKDAERDRQRQEREAERERQRLEKEAEKEKQRVERERERSLKDAEKERLRAEKEMKRQQDEAEKEQKRLEKEAEDKKRALALKKQASIMDKFLLKPYLSTGTAAAVAATTAAGGGGAEGRGEEVGGSMATLAVLPHQQQHQPHIMVAGTGLNKSERGPFLLSSRFSPAAGESRRDTLFLPPTVSPDTVAMATLGTGPPATSGMDAELGQAREGEVDIGVLRSRHLSKWRWAGRDHRRRKLDRWGKRRRPKASSSWGLLRAAGTSAAKAARNGLSSAEGAARGATGEHSADVEYSTSNKAVVDDAGLVARDSDSKRSHQQENSDADTCRQLFGDDRDRFIAMRNERTTSGSGREPRLERIGGQMKTRGSGDGMMEEFRENKLGEDVGAVAVNDDDDDDYDDRGLGRHRRRESGGQEDEEVVDGLAFADDHENQQHLDDDENREGTGTSMRRALLLMDEERGRAPKRRKLLQFHDNYRPAYYGTFSKHSDVIGARHPLRKDPSLDYDADSDAEWEEEEPGESLSDLDVKECEDDDEKPGDDEDSADGFVVPDGYLSEGEGAGADEDDGTSTEDVAIGQQERSRARDDSVPGGVQENEAFAEDLAKWRAMNKCRRLLAMATERALRTNCPLIVSRLLPPLPPRPPLQAQSQPQPPALGVIPAPATPPSSVVESLFERGKEKEGILSAAPSAGRSLDNDGKAGITCSISGASTLPFASGGPVSGTVSGTTSKLDDAILRALSVMPLEGDLVVEAPCPSGHGVTNDEMLGGGGDEEGRRKGGMRRSVGGAGGKGSAAGSRHGPGKKEMLAQAGGGGEGGTACAAAASNCNLPSSPAAVNGDAAAGSASKPPGPRVTPITKFFTKVSSSVVASSSPSSCPSSPLNANSPLAKVPPSVPSGTTVPSTDSRVAVALPVVATDVVSGSGKKKACTAPRTKVSPTMVRKKRESNGAAVVGACSPSPSPSLPRWCVRIGHREAGCEPADRTVIVGATTTEGCVNGGACGADSVAGKIGDDETGGVGGSAAAADCRADGSGSGQLSIDCSGSGRGKTKGCKRKL
ncbi:hypothetical protein CBR_g39948 [Chara braunii]|uniref:Chromatin assembly factor 1 subunit A dimerization domain-containing protein n=1 Tax=Chara braunii TaxID=69332 RepID=A0A388K1M0_CHABU|nr:hypothetical protein CBR_g39948 [Chara braunii]|eukprot:GBG63944.1 hypothetical protein CBR_g39948 [Chara braunii]